MKILYFSFVELDIPNACRAHTLGILNGFSRYECIVDALVPKPIKRIPEIANVNFICLRPWQFSLIGSLWIRLLGICVMLWLCCKNKYDFIYIRELENNSGPRLCSKLFKIPLYIEINELMVPYFIEKRVSLSFLKLVERNQALDFKQASGLIVPSIPMKKWLVDRYRLSPRKVHLIFNGTNLPTGKSYSQQDVRRSLKIPENSFCLGFVGNLYDRYDFKTLFQAIDICRSQIADLFLLIIGDGPMKDTLKNIIAERGMEEKSMFTGYIDPDRLNLYLPAMDVGLCLMDKKVLGRYGSITTKISTYGAYRISVIASGSHADAQTEGLKIPLFYTPAENPVELAKMIVFLYKNPDKRMKIGEEFQNWVLSRMTWTYVAGEIIRLAAKDERQQR